jgi:hypothetical protein
LYEGGKQVNRKGLAVSVILLFIGVAVAPYINFTVVKASINDKPEIIQPSNSQCDCENSTGVTSWPFPFICAILGAIGVLVVLLTWNTDIGDNLLTTILILYELFNCG